MKADRRRLARLRRLETVRTIAHQSAAAESAEAEGTLAQLEALSQRTGTMLQQYGTRDCARDGGELHQLGRFVAGLGTLGARTRDDAARARAIADAKMTLLAEADRRRNAVRDRAAVEERLLARAGEQVALGGRRAGPAETPET